MALVDYIPVLLQPSVLLMKAAYSFFLTALSTATIELHPFALLHPRQLSFKSFARFWNKNAQAMSQEMPGNTFELLASASGVVLDLGPGSGEMVMRFDPSKVTTIYGAEPAKELHPKLLNRANHEGFAGKYQPLLCGAEPESLIPALAKSGVLKEGGRDTAAEGVFDTIVMCRVICGVPKPQETLNTLYGLLKPGGRFIVSEHVKSPWRTEGRLAARLMQKVYTFLGWPFFLAGCELERDTSTWLRKASGNERWEKVDLKYDRVASAVPFIVGTLTKKGKSWAGVAK